MIGFSPNVLDRFKEICEIFYIFYTKYSIYSILKKYVKYSIYSGVNKNLIRFPRYRR